MLSEPKRSLTVERFADQDGSIALERLHLDLVDGWHVIEAFTINEKFEAAGHGHFGHARLRSLISVANTQ